MSGIKVDFLLKDEISYELWCRGVSFPENETVERLRKILRSSLKNNLEVSYKNLQSKITLVSEVELIKKKVFEIQSNYVELNSDSRIQDIVRAENKIAHCKFRIENLLKFQLTEEQTTILKEQLGVVTEFLNKVKSLSLKENVKESFIRKMSDSNEEEERFIDIVDHVVQNSSNEQNDVFLEKSDIHKVNSVHSLPENISKPPNVASLVFDSNLYNKLPNPIEKYLSNLKISDGLDINELLVFIKTMLKMKRETKLTDKHISDLLLNHCSGPLLNKLLSCNEQGLTVSQTNACILNTFIPYNMLDNLRRQFVNRPQKINEPISLYIAEIRDHAEIFMCNLVESDIVNIVKNGLNPETRSKLVFCGDPKTFNDLDELCIKFNNVNYSDFSRINQAPSFSSAVTPRQQRVGLSCYICGRSNHIAKNCYRNQSGNFQKNVQRGGRH